MTKPSKFSAISQTITYLALVNREGRRISLLAREADLPGLSIFLMVLVDASAQAMVGLEQAMKSAVKTKAGQVIDGLEEAGRTIMDAVTGKR